jgi:hypothetical protein
MTNSKFATGAFVFTRARGLQPREPDELTPIARKHGIDITVIPTYAGDRTAIGRALSQASAGLAREGFLLRPITRTSTTVIYGIVREQRDEADQKLEHDFEATVSWSAEPDPETVNGDHEIARRVADAYRNLRGKVVADDWSSSITAHLEAHDAARVRGDGRVYWVPPQRLAEVRQFGAFLAEVGIDLILCEIESENRTVVQIVAQESLADQLQTLETEAQSFDGTQKPSTYTRRLEEYQRLRERAVLYRDALGVGAEKAQSVLAELEKKVTAMLEVRSTVVVHRDGTIDRVEDPPARPFDAPKPVTLQFAGATFRPGTTPGDDHAVQVFTSGEPAAKSVITALETMGLADRWQAAGPVQVNIRNSGPVGAEVSISVRLPGKTTVAGVARHLAALGIGVERLSGIDGGRDGGTSKPARDLQATMDLPCNQPPSGAGRDADEPA